MPQFILKIELGNEAMQTGSDIQEALQRVSKRMADVDFKTDYIDKIPILDINGNKVGYYEVVE